MFTKIVDVLREVFWLKSKKTKKKSKAKAKAVVKKSVKKKTVKKVIVKTKPKSVVKPAVKPLKAATKPLKLKKPLVDPSLVKVGEITHYFERIKVCVVKITQGTILIGDRVTIASAKSSFVQKIWSMQIESVDVKVAKKGQLIGLKVDKAVTVGDIVYK